MKEFIFTCLLWSLALYGLIEIIKNIIYIHSCNKIHSKGINMVITVKNQEDKIDGFLRSLNFRLLYGKEDSIENIIVLDLNSTDNTKKIVDNLTYEISNIKLINWNEFDELFGPK